MKKDTYTTKITVIIRVWILLQISFTPVSASSEKGSIFTEKSNIEGWLVVHVDPFAAFEERKSADLWAVSALTGEKLSEIQHLQSPPVYDGLIAAQGCLYVSTAEGCVHCFGE